VALSRRAGCEVYLKLETVLPIRTFKVRGALNKVMRMPPEKRAAGVITASAGNHGLGVAYAAAAFQTKATVYVPEAANQLKVEAIKSLGARVVAAGATYHEAFVAASTEQERTGATFVHAYNDPDVVAGQGTVGLELLSQLDRFDSVIVPIGGGGLISGIAMYVKSRQPLVRVIGVEPVGADSMWRSLEAGRIVALDRVSTIADGLAASSPGTLTFAMARRFVDEIVRVEEEEMLRAIRLMFELEHVLTEPAGAAGVAGLLRLRPRSPGERVVVIISGANVSGEVLARALKSP